MQVMAKTSGFPYRLALLACLLAAWPGTVAAEDTVAAVPESALEMRMPSVVRHFDVEDGLPQSSVNAMLQTRDGFLWIGTYGGLVRFDGHAFRTFGASATGLGGLRILTLYEDAAQRLWIGTEDAGVSVYERGRFRPVPVCRIGCQVHALFSADGRDLLTLTSEGVFRIDPTSLTARRIASAPGQFNLSARSKGQVLIGGLSGLGRLVGEEVQPIPLPDGRRTVTAMAAVGGILWVVLDSAALYRFDAGSGVWTFVRDGLHPQTRLLAVGTDGLLLSDAVEGSRWIVGRRDVAPLHAIGRTEAISALGGAGGALWIGTSTKGLWQVRPSRVSLLRLHDNPDLPGRVLAADGAGGMWLSMACGSVWHLDASGKQTPVPVDTIGDDGACIHSLAFDKTASSLWIGTTGGVLARRAGERIEVVGRWPNAGQVGIWRLRDGSFWTANRRFVGRLRFAANGALATVDPVAELAGMDVKGVVEARAGGVWIVGDRGAFRVVDKAVVERWGPAQGIASRFFRALHEDADGVLWVGSYGDGLFRIERGKVHQFTEANGLFDDTVSCILPDASGRLWLAGNRGISLLQDRRVGPDGLHVRTLTRDDGLISQELNGGAVSPCADDGAGHLWFAMMAGFVQATPAWQLDRAAGIVPTAYIDQVLVSQQPLDVFQPGQLAINASNLEIFFGAIDLTGPDKVRFRYRLTGASGDDGGWIDAGSSRRVMLSVVPWGQVAFEVQAREQGGVWSPSAVLRLDHPRPWYQYRWIWMVVSLASLLALLWMTRERVVPDEIDALLGRLRKPEPKDSGSG